jgi:hypothetical protein
MINMIWNSIPINEGASPSISVGKSWFRFFVDLYNSCTKGSQEAVTVLTGISPFNYVPTQKGQVLVSGGTVSAISLSRDGKTFYSTGQTAGLFPLSAADTLQVTFTGSPTMVFFPL